MCTEDLDDEDETFPEDDSFDELPPSVPIVLPEIDYPLPF